MARLMVPSTVSQDPGTGTYRSDLETCEATQQRSGLRALSCLVDRAWATHLVRYCMHCWFPPPSLSVTTLRGHAEQRRLPSSRVHRTMEHARLDPASSWTSRYPAHVAWHSLEPGPWASKSARVLCPPPVAWVQQQWKAGNAILHG